MAPSELTQVPVRLRTRSSWMIGTLHVPNGIPFLAFLNTAETIFKVTSVTIRGNIEPLEFLALRRDAVEMILPEDGVDIGTAEPAEGSPRVVACWMHSGEVIGVLHLPDDIRVSDHLLHLDGFVKLKDCTARNDAAVIEGAPAVFVNARSVIGVAERPPD